MKVRLKHYTPLHICSDAIRKCWASEGKSDSHCYTDGHKKITGIKDKELIERIGNKYKHASTLEHLVYNFEIIGVSRALLQELARHRMASPSVKSTRYTLKELKNEEPFIIKGLGEPGIRYEIAKNYLVFTGDEDIDKCSVVALENLRRMLVDGKSNDIAKYCLPESYKTELSWTINARSLQNFLNLRSSSAALWEIRNLAQALYDSLPEEHKYLFTHCVPNKSIIGELND